MRLKFSLAIAAIAFSAAACADARATSRTADPSSLERVLQQARAGDTIVLAPGHYSGVKLRGRTFEPALTIDARKATFNGVLFNDVDGITISGGDFQLPAATTHPRTGRPVFGFALRMDGSKNISISNAVFTGPGAQPEAFGEGYGIFVVRGAAMKVRNSTFEGFKSGIVLGRVEGFEVLGNTFSSMRSDGVQVAESRKGLIEGNECRSTRIREKEHPDCIQLWSRPTSPPTADVTIRRNKMEGHTQGIGLFNHVRKGVNDGGFDRILIEENDIYVGFPHGIALSAARDSIVRNNRVRTYPGARWRASVNVSPEVERCGNVVAAHSRWPGEKDRPC